MKITKMIIKNFRLLKEVKLNLDDETTLIIGKNNTGKTSIIKLLDIFFEKSKSSFSINDFNLSYLSDKEREITNIDNSDNQYELDFFISLDIIVEYNENDSLEILSKMMSTLDVDDNTVVIEFKYTFNKLKTNDVIDKLNLSGESLANYLQDQNIMEEFFELTYNVKDVLDENKQVVEIKQIKNLIEIKVINALRTVDSSESVSPKNRMGELIGKLTKGLNVEDQEEYYNRLRTVMTDYNNSVNAVDEPILSEVISSLHSNTGVSPRVRSILNTDDRIKANQYKLSYDIGDSELPEHYNGLGILNYINMLLDIHIYVEEIKVSTPSICLFIIEEPEAHTHPQMQYQFIRNVPEILKEIICDISSDLQLILTTHSSHVISQSNFKSIRYLKANANNEVILKDIAELETALGDISFGFLCQYLTTQNSELFFADKAIFIEGTSERILLPAIIKKMHRENENTLFTQYLSVIEMGGSHSHF